MDNGQAFRHIDGIGPEWAVKIRKGEVHDPKKPYAVWTKRHAAFVLLALFLAAVLIVIAAAALPYAYANATAAAQRRLPIYCTDRPGKVVSLTFDAAWGTRTPSSLLRFWENTRCAPPSSWWESGWIAAEIRSRPCSTRGMKS